ncbi:hypothetical protein PUN28_010151 [Cardiocondyla obscurior]|uniref:Uncharacterized protein n=1 Tax=Cardiocondyla obscurior TaxID=286306 RepID=A0AAW2FQR2_9HYME
MDAKIGTYRFSRQREEKSRWTVLVGVRNNNRGGKARAHVVSSLPRHRFRPAGRVRRALLLHAYMHTRG